MAMAVAMVTQVVMAMVVAMVTYLDGEYLHEEKEESC
jgi:hypothetical protein